MSESLQDKELRAIFERKFENESATPPPMAWSNIQTTLPKATPFFKFGAWFWTSILVLTLGVGSIVYLGKINSKKTNVELSKNQVPEKKEKIQNIETENKKEIIEKNREQDLVNKTNDETQNDENLKQNTQSKSINQEKYQNQKGAVQITNTDTQLSSTRISNVQNRKLRNQNQAKVETTFKKSDSANSNSDLAKIEGTTNAKVKGRNLENLNNLSEKNAGAIVNQTEKSTNTGDFEKDNVANVNQSANLLKQQEEIKLEIQNFEKEEVTQTLLLRKPNYLDDFVFHSLVLKPISIKIFKRNSVEFYVARGINLRSYKGMRNENSKTSPDFDKRTIALKNRAIGLNYGYRLNNRISFHTGFSLGSNVWKSRTFQKTVLNAKIIADDGYKINTVEGQYKIANAQTDSYFNGPNDSVAMKIKFVQRSAFFSIPLLVRFTAPTKTILQPFFSVGTTIDLKSRNRTVATVEANGVSKTINFTNFAKTGRLKTGFQTSVGLSTNPKNRVGFYTELVYNRPFGVYYSLKNELKIVSNQLQLRVGFVVNF